MVVLYSLGQTLKGRFSSYSLTKEIYKTVWLALNDTGGTVIIKGVQHSRIHNERDVLLKFQHQAPLRRLVDEIVQPTQPPGIVLQYMDDDLLEAGEKKRLNRAEIKHVAKIVLRALAALHKQGYVHTDVKPSNILCDYKKVISQDIRFSEVLLADFGSCVPVTSDYANDGDLIGASMFRSPEANLRLSWGQSTDIWSFGTTLMSLFFGKYHLFNPQVDIEDPKYDRLVLERNHIFFGPFPLSYREIAPRKKLNELADIHITVGDKRKPFHMIKDPEFEEADKAFIMKIMKMDPRY